MQKNINNWRTKNIGEICDIVNGGTPETNIAKFWNGNIPWITPKDMGRLDSLFVNDTQRKITQLGLKNSSAKIIPSYSIVLSSRAPIGYLAINKKEITTNQGCKGIIPRKDADVYFLFYFLKTSVELLNSLGSGTTFKELSSTKLKEVAIPLPPLPEQKRIVKILDEVFEEVWKAKGNAEKNLRNSRELFESYLQSVFENKGEGWEEKRLGDKKLLTIIDGDRGKNYPKKSDFFDEGYCLFLNTKNVRPDGFRFKNKMFITKEKDLALGNGKLQRNDVIMTTRGTIGNLGLYNDGIEFDYVRINSGMLIFRPDLKIISPEYLFEVFRSGIFKIQMKKHTSGAAQPQLPIKTLINFTIPVPKSLSEQKAIVKKLDALSEETKKLEELYKKEIADLEELKKSVLQKAFRGEL